MRLLKKVYSKYWNEKSLDQPTNEKALDTVRKNLNSETDEIQNIFMLDNADYDDHNKDEDIELVDIIVDKKSKVNKEIPIGQMVNETQVEIPETAMNARSINTEFWFNLSSISNITDSLNKFGGKDADTTFLVPSNLSEQINKDLLA